MYIKRIPLLQIDTQLHVRSFEINAEWAIFLASSDLP
jgi:hypothetical protein